MTLRIAVCTLVLLLAACDVRLQQPLGQAYPGLMREAEAACIDRAERRGLSVRRIADRRVVTGSGGRVVGADLRLGAVRRGDAVTLDCAYTAASGRVRLEEAAGGPPVRPRPDRGSMREAVRACRREVAREGFDLRRILSRDPVEGRGGRLRATEVVMQVERRGRPARILCDYDYRRETAQLRRLDRDDRYDRDDRDDRYERDDRYDRDDRYERGDMREAVRACRRLARREGFEPQRILSREEVRGGRNAEIVLRVTRGGRTYPIRCDYDFRAGRARLGR